MIAELARLARKKILVLAHVKELVEQNSEKYKRDFVCVEDICKLQEKMFDVDAKGIFNVGTGRPVSFQTVGSAIANKYNADIRYVSIPDNIKGQYQKYTCANLDKLNSVVDMKWKSIEDYIND